LRTWKKLGLFSVKRGSIQIADEFKGLCADPGKDPLFWEFRTAALDIALRPENNKHVGQPEDKKGLQGAADFTYAICWMLSQDPHQEWTYKLVDAKQSDAKGKGPKPLQNDTRWVPLVHWSCFFGLALDVGTLFVDPTEAISRRLDKIFEKKKALPQKDFFQRLEKELPILHKGKYRKTAEKQFLDEHQVRNEELSVALSHALLTLVDRQEIILEAKSDTEEKISLNRDREDYVVAGSRDAWITGIQRGPS